MRKDFLGPLAGLFRSRSTPLIGVDISTTAVKMVELGGTREKPELVRYTIEALPKDSVTDGNIGNMEAVAETVARAYRKLGARTRSAAAALPSNMVITKRIKLPAAQREEDLEATVEAEANQYIPFALDEVNLDFYVIGPVADDATQVDVLIAAARKEKVDDRVEALESGGLKAVIVDVDSLAVASACELLAEGLPGRGVDQNIGILDIGANSTRFYVFRNGEQIFMRESPIGGQQLTQEIQRTYNMTAEEAEAAKRAGNLPANYESDVLRAYVDTLAIEAARALQFFLTSTNRGQLDCILLAGGGATLVGLPEAVSRRTSVAASVANPFAGMSLGSGVRQRQLAQDAPSLLIACGLAMRRFDA
ncbi:MAG: pilus assembly protein PilM [Casimicrobiaceae bacterium]|nr:pilus assembly protein PilM [Casimicrobiaceae bacterium]MDW8311902.1 pilus assembly protein PilM [Burkholderiales bacterium]